jgi:hypothetical protein
VDTNLRALERRTLAMKADGLDATEIASRLRRSPEHVERILAWTELPRTGDSGDRVAPALERRVLALRWAGESHDTIAGRFNKTPRFIRQVEGLAHYRRAMELLG